MALEPGNLYIRGDMSSITDICVKKEEILGLEHNDIITSQMEVMGLHLAEFCFPNLYFFRHTHEYRVLTTEHSLFGAGVSYDKKRYLMPLVGPERATQGCFNDLKTLMRSGEYDMIFPIPEEWLCCFSEDEYEWTHNEDDSDYLFFQEKLAGYPGKKMHKKRNLVNQFLRSYDPLVLPLGSEVRSDALKVLDIWQNTTVQEMATSDYHQCAEALERQKEFRMSGIMVYADGHPAGFMMGEALNDETFTIHFAKADISFKGIYQFLFSRFASEIGEGYKYINMEQDMGNPGLRHTKRSYYPDLMAHKYRITLKS